jgi:hypothetical protein
MSRNVAVSAAASNVEKRKKEREEEDEDKNSGPFPWTSPDMPLTYTHALLHLQLWHTGHLHHSLLLFA